MSILVSGAKKVFTWVASRTIPSRTNFMSRLKELGELSSRVINPANGDSIQAARDLESLFDRRDALIADYSPHEIKALELLADVAFDKSENVETRRQAIACMHIIGNPTALTFLELLRLADENKIIQDAAKNAIEGINQKVAHRNRLIEAILSKNKAEKS